MIDIIVSFLIAVIVGMGIGGGGFLVIYLTLCMNYEQIIAQGTNLLFFFICGVSSLFVHFRKRKIFTKEIIPIIVFSVPGTLLGAFLANKIDPDIPRIMLGILLCISGITTLIKVIKEFIDEKKKKISKKDFTK